MQVETTRLYRVKAVAQMCAVSPATIYRAIESGQLTALRFGNGTGSLRVPGEAVNAYLAVCAVTTAQLDGLACLVCAADFMKVTTPHVPIGRSHTGSQVFACSHHTALDISQALPEALGEAA